MNGTYYNEQLWNLLIQKLNKFNATQSNNGTLPLGKSHAGANKIMSTPQFLVYVPASLSLHMTVPASLSLHMALVIAIAMAL